MADTHVVDSVEGTGRKTGQSSRHNWRLPEGKIARIVEEYGEEIPFQLWFHLGGNSYPFIAPVDFERIHEIAFGESRSADDPMLRARIKIMRVPRFSMHVLIINGSSQLLTSISLNNLAHPLIQVMSEGVGERRISFIEEWDDDVLGRIARRASGEFKAVTRKQRD